MQLLRSSWLVLVASALAVLFWFFRPGGVAGPEPEPVPPPEEGFNHEALGVALAPALRPDGTIDYGLLRAEPAALDRYLGLLRATSPASAPHRFRSPDDRLAYYLNAYNAFVLAAVRDRCPLASVEDVHLAGGFFWRIRFLMGEDEVTLSAIESDPDRIAAVSASEPAVHFALVKGALGSPPLPARPYEGATIRDQLAELSTRVARDPRFVRREADRLYVSEIFRWYAPKFGGDAREWLKRVAPELAEGAEHVEFIPYDWSLNGTCG